MPTLRGHVYDARSGATLPARVHVLESAGKFRAPPDALLKVGGGPPFFYSDGTFSLDVLCGPADVVVERGTEYRPLLRTVEIPRSGTLEVAEGEVLSDDGLWGMTYFVQGAIGTMPAE